MPDADRNTFPSSCRLHGRPAFSAVYGGRVRESSGPLMIYALPNSAGRHRLGISIGRKAGTAVVRNRIKRLLREAFRTQRHALPGAYDLVVTVRPHKPMGLDDYARLIQTLTRRLHAAWEKRRRRPPAGPGPADRPDQAKDAD